MVLSRIGTGVVAGAGVGIVVLVMVAACSSADRPPATGAASSSGVSSSGGSSGDAATSTDGGADAAPLDAGDASTDAGIIPCYGDTPLTGDGGALPLECTSSSSCAAHCLSIKDHYRVAVAQVAIACIRKLPSCTDLNDVRACVDQGLGNACAQTTSAGYCKPLVTACDPMAGGAGSNIDEAGCERFAHALSAAGRDAFSTCLQSKITAGTCAVEVITCANQIRE